MVNGAKIPNDTIITPNFGKISCKKSSFFPFLGAFANRMPKATIKTVMFFLFVHFTTSNYATSIMTDFNEISYFRLTEFVDTFRFW